MWQVRDSKPDVILWQGWPVYRMTLDYHCCIVDQDIFDNMTAVCGRTKAGMRHFQYMHVDFADIHVKGQCKKPV